MIGSNLSSKAGEHGRGRLLPPGPPSPQRCRLCCELRPLGVYSQCPACATHVAGLAVEDQRDAALSYMADVRDRLKARVRKGELVMRDMAKDGRESEALALMPDWSRMNASYMALTVALMAILPEEPVELAETA